MIEQNLYNMELNKEIEEKLQKKILELKSLCVTNKIPLFISAVVKTDENETKYRNEIVSPESLDLTLKDDKITKMINVMNGFDTVLPTKILEVRY